MKALKFALVAVAVLASLASVAQAGSRGGGGHGGGYYPGGGGHHHGGGWGRWYGPSIGIYYGGGPYGWGSYGYGYGYGLAYPVVPAYVYGPPAVVNSTAGIVYVERDQAGVSTQRAAPAQAAPSEAAQMPPPAPASQWWYLCASPRGAYPYVRECPGGWERVPAVPPGQVQ